MIDTWLAAGVILGILSVFALLRSLPAKSRDDRLVALAVGVSGMMGTGLVLGIALGTMIVTDAAIVICLICYGILFAAIKTPGAGAP